ncbi:hypothetical protein [Bradyrhizobium sp. Tv2a-2]|uniref:hypothetical protein n=1 Tax=Bradyrhizobium sp. Tv2a-2 TaxID=113395 RepID=UPI0003FE41E8|nr:hypothetical protein [Bradyrhizobium sp. Tv2a-2]
MANKLSSLALCLLVGLCVAPVTAIQPAAANDSVASRAVDAKALASADTSGEAAKAATRKPGSTSAKGPYYVDFRARTAASWGHAFVWYGKTSERAVDVAGLTPAGDTTSYIVGYFTWVPSETGASYGDLDPQYLTAHYKVYLNEADAKRVFAYIKKLQASSPVWNAETTNCNGFIGQIAEFMGLKTPSRWIRPEGYVNELKALNSGRQIVRLSEQQ